MSRLKEFYTKEVVPALMKEFNFSSPMQVPRLVKIVLNTGVGESTQNQKAIDFAVYTLTQMSGQKPMVTKSKKAISNFKIRRGLPIGCMVTMRQARMFDFLDRLISIALPRVRDFRGLPSRGFDGKGNYTFGVKESIVFPEVIVDKLDKIRGLDITFVTTAKNDKEGFALLQKLGMPFRKGGLNVQESSESKAA